MASKLKSFHIDVGNSNTGPIGFCARIRATSKKKALSILCDALSVCIEVEPADHEDAVEYIHVYTNTDNVSEADISDDMIEDVDEDEDEDEE